jgi:hypothetical protein
MYINGVNVQDRVVESPYNGSYGSAAMRHNRGPLYINPGDIFGTNESENPVKNTLETTIMMANLTYFNYALSETEVMQLFNKKFTKSPAVPPTTSSSVGDRYPIAPISQDNNNLPRQF